MRGAASIAQSFLGSTEHNGECCFASLPEVKRLGAPMDLKAMAPQRHRLPVHAAAGPPVRQNDPCLRVRRKLPKPLDVGANSMSTICGICCRGNPSGLRSMLASLASASPGGDWVDPNVGVGLGFGRSRSSPLAEALHFDRKAGLAAVVDVRLDDRAGLCDALGLQRPQAPLLPTAHWTPYLPRRA